MAADADGRFTGEEELLYVSATEPEDAEDIADYVLVGFLTNNPFDGSSDEVTLADKSSGGWRSSLATTSGYTIAVEGHRILTGDAGQKLIRSAWLNKTGLYWLITTNVATHEAKHGRASVTAYAEDSPNSDGATMSATLSGQGTPTFFTVTA
jgi:predicted secreted protein